MNNIQVNRRDFLTAAAGAGCVAAWASAPALAESSTSPRYRIAACDWMLLKRQKLGAFPLARACGLDGIEIDMGSLGNRPDFVNALRDPAVRGQFLAASKETGVAICAVAMSAFYGQSFADHPRADHFVAEWIATMKGLDVKVGFLPFGVQGNVKADPAVRARFVAALKRAAAGAEAAGVVIAIETNLDAAAAMRFLDEVGSPAVRVSYNLGDAIENGYNLDQEIRALGRERISQVHCKEGSVWLGHGLIDFPKVKRALDAINWSGWLIIERSRLPGKSVQENFSANARYLKSLFQAGG